MEKEYDHGLIDRSYVRIAPCRFWKRVFVGMTDSLDLYGTQSEGVTDHGYRAEAHCGSSDHRTQKKAEKG